MYEKLHEVVCATWANSEADLDEALLALPGIGKSAALAVMEANVKRILCRIYALKNPKCEECPFSKICKAYEECYFLYPEKKRKIIPTRNVNIVVRYYNKKLYLKQKIV